MRSRSSRRRGRRPVVDLLLLSSPPDTRQGTRHLIAMYLLPEILSKLKPKFSQWLREGVDIVTVRSALAAVVTTMSIHMC
eukprot:170344-Hanusia_phi.AAC.2